MANNSLSKFNKFTKFTKYQFEIETPLWLTFKTIAISQGLRVKDAIKEAIVQYIETHKTQHQNIEVKIVKNIEAKQDLLQFIIEEETKNLLKALLEAKKRGASGHHINQLKHQIITNIKKHPSISEDLASQIKVVFQNLRD